MLGFRPVAAVITSKRWARRYCRAGPSRAEQIYEAVYTRLNLMPTEWMGSEIDTWITPGWVRHQREAELRNQEDIGVYHSVTGCAMLPIDYPAMALSPDADGGRHLNS